LPLLLIRFERAAGIQPDQFARTQGRHVPPGSACPPPRADASDASGFRPIARFGRTIKEADQPLVRPTTVDRCTHGARFRNGGIEPLVTDAAPHIKVASPYQADIARQDHMGAWQGSFPTGKQLAPLERFSSRKTVHVVQSVLKKVCNCSLPPSVEKADIPRKKGASLENLICTPRLSEKAIVRASSSVIRASTFV
jgi:hypothetical protein